MTSERLAQVHTVARQIIRSCVLWKGIDWSRGASSDETGEFVNDSRNTTTDIDAAEAVSSKFMGSLDQHLPIIDLDHRAVVIPSSTNGHGHLYIDKKMPWEDLEKLLTVMVEVGLVEPGYLAASRTRRCTFARLPWVRKGAEKQAWEPAEVEEFLGTEPAPDPWAARPDWPDAPF